MKKRFSDEQIVTILREVDTQGKSIEETCKRHKFSVQTFYLKKRVLPTITSSISRYRLYPRLGKWLMCGSRWKVRPSISPSIMILRVGSTARSVNGNTVATIMPPEELGGI